ncbi:MAG: ParB/RepB/Spo0J family partition protein [Eubacterium sp.]|nr:ParB/RepB/Spo0J family partition protein [Eubacterium sp.]
MAVKRGLNMAKGLESLIPQGNPSARKKEENQAEQPGTQTKQEKKPASGSKTVKKSASAAKSKKKTTASAVTEEKEAKAEKSAAARTQSAETEPEKNVPVELRISQIVPNQNQPRTEFDETALEELADSIRQFGVIQPLLVQKSGKYYEIIAGERRWRAAKLAGLKKVPVIIREYSKQEIVEISLIENIQREDLNAIEEARAYKRLLEEFDLKQEEVAKRVAKSRSAVTNSMRLLNLDERVQEMLIAEQISAGHARALLAVENPEIQYAAAAEIAAGHLSVRETERLVKRLLKPKKEKKEPVTDTQIEAAYQALEEQLMQRIGTKVSISRGRGSRGKIEIEYYSQEDLDRIIDLIR